MLKGILETDSHVTAHLGKGNGGWLRAVRKALGMSLETFGKRVGLETRSGAKKLEEKIADGSISVNRLHEVAEAVGCRVEIRVVPEQPLDEFVRLQARKQAIAKLARVQQSMRLEDQALSAADYERLVSDLTESILARGKKALWSEV